MYSYIWRHVHSRPAHKLYHIQAHAHTHVLIPRDPAALCQNPEWEENEESHMKRT